MIETFLATLNPMLMLFICIVVGFVLSKTKILPESASSVMAKLEVWVFCPALSFFTMAVYFTIGNLGTHLTNVVISVLVVSVVVLPLAIVLARLFVRQNSYKRNVYKYAMAFSNMGYLGDPVVESMLGGSGLALYKMYTLPMSLVIYTWGISTLVPSDKKQKKNILLNLVNAPTIAMVLGMIVGISGIGSFLLGDVANNNLTFFGSTLSALKACMGPVAMLIAGVTIAKYPIKPMLTNIKVYLATMVRMVILPAITVAFVYALTLLANVAFGLLVDNTVMHLAYFCSGCALGLNTVVFPEAYGGDPSTGASMAMISHTSCVIIIPLMYALVCLLFPVI
jgi:predicted permease